MALSATPTAACASSPPRRSAASGNRGRGSVPVFAADLFEVTGAPMTLRDGSPVRRDPREGFPFSMKDLALPDHLPGLRSAGVACFKIEGRKKSPLYVATTTDYYRRLLDGTLDREERPAVEADLQTVFSRPWTGLFLRSHKDKEVADRDTVGHRGTRIGKVEPRRRLAYAWRRVAPVPHRPPPAAARWPEEMPRSTCRRSASRAGFSGIDRLGVIPASFRGEGAEFDHGPGGKSRRGRPACGRARTRGRRARLLLVVAGREAALSFPPTQARDAPGPAAAVAYVDHDADGGDCLCRNDEIAVGRVAGLGDRVDRRRIRPSQRRSEDGDGPARRVRPARLESLRAGGLHLPQRCRRLRSRVEAESAAPRGVGDAGPESGGGANDLASGDLRRGVR